MNKFIYGIENNEWGPFFKSLEKWGALLLVESVVSVLMAGVVIAFPEIAGTTAGLLLPILFTIIITSLIDDDSIENLNKLIMDGVDKLPDLK